MVTMRALFSTTAGSGHFGPMVPYALACRNAGHDVTVAAPESFAAVVERAGLVHGPFADAPPDQLGAAFARLAGEGVYEDRHDDPAVAEARNRLELEVVVGEVFGRIDSTAALPGMQALVASWRPDLIVHEPAELSSYIVAERNGIRVDGIRVRDEAWDFRTREAFAAFCRATFAAWTSRLPEDRWDQFIAEVLDRYRSVAAGNPEEANTFKFYQMDVALTMPQDPGEDKATP